MVNVITLGTAKLLLSRFSCYFRLARRLALPISIPSIVYRSGQLSTATAPNGLAVSNSSAPQLGA